MAREMNAQEIVRWLNQIERRYRRLRWITVAAVLVAVVALVLPALPERVSPWPLAVREAESFQAPDRANTGGFRLGVETGRDPRLVLTNTNEHANASLEIDEGSPLLDLHDQAGHQVALRLAAPHGWEANGERSRTARESGLGMNWPGASDELDRRLRLGGEGDLVGLDLWSGRDGGVRMWAGRRDTPRDARGEPVEAATREPGAALVLLDQEDRQRVVLGLTGPATVAPLLENGAKAPETAPAAGKPVDPTPSLVLLDAEGKERARLRLDDAPPLPGSSGPGGVRPTLVLQDEIGRKRIILGFDDRGNPYLRIMSGNEVIWTAP